jgi:hypothetical protein
VDQDNLALSILTQAVLSSHWAARESVVDGSNVDFVDFTDEEIKEMVVALWVDRYTTSRRNFEDTVSGLVVQKVAGK